MKNNSLLVSLISLVFVAQSPVSATARISEADLNMWVEAHKQGWLQNLYPDKNPEYEAQQAASRILQCRGNGWSSVVVNHHALTQFNSHDEPWKVKWNKIRAELEECPSSPPQPLQPPTEITNNNRNDADANSNSRSNANSDANANADSSSVSDSQSDAQAVADAYVEANPNASVGDIANAVRSEVNVSPQIANNIATEAKQRQAQNQRQSQTANGGEATGGRSDANNEGVNVDNSSTHRSFDAGSHRYPEAARSAAQSSCKVYARMHEVEVSKEFPLRTQGGVAIGANGAYGKYDEDTNIAGGFSFSTGGSTEGGTFENCRKEMRSTDAIFEGIGNWMQNATIDDAKRNVDQGTNVEVNAGASANSTSEGGNKVRRWPN